MPTLPKQKNPKKSKVSQSSSQPIDSRFAAFATSSKFRFPSKKNTKVKLDKRFAEILEEEEFTNQASVDRYGRKISKKAGQKKLERLYDIGDEDEESSDGSEAEDASEDSESGDDDSEVLKELKKAGGKIYDPARDGGFSESETGDSTDDEEELGPEVDGELPEETEAVPMGDVSKRLAVVNLDWDNIRAEDIFAVASSFCPADAGKVINVTVYPSEFGRERMDREDLEGPPKEIFAGPDSSKKKEKHEDDTKQTNQNEEDGEFDSVALRNYQLERLRYYYAIITCSSETVAKALYDAMDGQEFLSSANFFDLRFVPDDVTFEETPRDTCDSTVSEYRPTDFTTDALMHSKVKLTWDAEDTRRKEVQKRAFSRAEMNDNDLQAYVASNSSSDDTDEEEELEEQTNEVADGFSTTSRATIRQQKRDNLRAALGLDLNPVKRSKDLEANPVGGMQVTFTPALATQKEGESVFENGIPEREPTTAEKYVQKERERKAKRKEAAKAKRTGVSPENDANEKENGQDDAGFDDPFFNKPDAAIAEAKKAKKDKKHRKPKVDEDVVDEKGRKELELLLMNETSGLTKSKEVEKPKDKKDKKSKKNKKVDIDEDEDDLELQENDPRLQKLSSLYDDPDFAIDTTSHMYKETKATKALLQEKRKRGEKHSIDNSVPKASSTEVDDLLQRVKKKAKR